VQGQKVTLQPQRNAKAPDQTGRGPCEAVKLEP
jgi:hypothetical protein